MSHEITKLNSQIKQLRQQNENLVSMVRNLAIRVGLLEAKQQPTEPVTPEQTTAIDKRLNEVLP